MSLWDDAVAFIQNTYSDSTAAYLDLRNYLPGSLFIDGAPVPLKSTLDAAFLPGAPRRSVVEAYLLIFGGAHIGGPSDGVLMNGVAASVIRGETIMGTLVIPDCFQVSIEGVNGSRPVFNVIGVENSSGTAAGAAAAVKAAWEGSGFMVMLPTQYAVVEYKAVDISSTTGPVAVLGSTAVGTNATSQSTAASAALVRWTGSTRSRSGSGRLYFGPLCENLIDGDGRTLNSGVVTQLTTAIAAFRASLNSAGYPLVVLSRKDSAAYPISAAVVESTIATQRRRLRK